MAAAKETFWSRYAGRDENYQLDPNKTYNSESSADELISELFGPPAGQIDPVYHDAVYRRDREWITKVEINGVEYGDQTVVDFQIEDGIVDSDEFTIGTVVISRLTLRLRIFDEIPANAKVVPYVALKTTDGQTDWEPLGEFYIDNREKLPNGVWVFECYDKLVFADVAYISQLTYPTTMQAVWDEICDRLGFIYDESVQIDPTYTLNAGPAGYTCRQVMGFIAGVNGASVYAGRDGVIRFKHFAASDVPKHDVTASDYIRVKQTNPPKTYTRIIAIYDEQDKLSYEAGEGDENHTLYLNNPLITQEMVNNLLNQIKGLTYVPIEMDVRGYPHFVVGDKIAFDRIETQTWEEANMAWGDANFPWDGEQEYQTYILNQTFTFKGGLGMSLQAPSKSEQESEFQLEGSLTQQVNRLTQSAVRFGKAYYGVTHSKDEGIVVQRTDGLAKAVFNADELSFWTENERALWFDVPNRRWKFTGTLEGVDGKFTGIIEGGSFLGGNIVIGSGNNVFKADSNGIWAGHADFASAPFRVDMTGHLYAVDAYLEGEINAESGRIGGWFINADVLTSSTTSYPRTVIDAFNDEITFFGTSSEWIKIGSYGNTNRPFLEFRTNAGIARIDLDSSGELDIGGATVSVTVNSGSEITLNGYDIWLDASHRVYIQDFYVFEDWNGDSLGWLLDQKAERTEAANSMSYNSSTKVLTLYDVDGNFLDSVTIS